MPVPLLLLSILLYCLQQLGMMLGAGGECVVLFSYLSALRDGTVVKEEKDFITATKQVVWWGLLLVALSGLAITAMHFAVGQGDIVTEPTYLFKWLLVFAVFAPAVAERKLEWSKPLVTGFVGGTWLGLFILHVLAPVTGWGPLVTLYALWMAVFMAIWMGVTRFLMRDRTPKPKVAQAPAPKMEEEEEDVPEVIPQPIVLSVAEPQPEPVPAPEPPTIAPPAPMLIKPNEVEEKLLPAPEPEPVVVQMPQAPRPPQEQKPVFTNLETLGSFPAQATFKSGMPMLHPHLTGEGPEQPDTVPEDPLPTAKAPSGVASGIQFNDEHITHHLPAVRVMPQRPEDLESGHERAPLVKYG
jgi:hypothetical protein